MNIGMIPLPQRQSGAILVISLLMLLVLTVLGVVMMQTTRMQERMAGNTRDLSAALQGSEAAVRYAEQQLAAYTSRPDTDSSATCATAGANTVCDKNVLPVAIYDPTFWSDSTKSKLYGHAGATTTSVAQLPAPPQYTDERLGFIRDNLDTGQDPPEGRDFFQLTGHSTGMSGKTNTVVQSTYARRF